MAVDLFLKKRGQDVMIYPHARILMPEQISLGNSVVVDDYAMLLGGQGLEVGDFVHIVAYASILGGGSFRMGSFGAISGGARVWTGTEDIEGLMGARVPIPYRRPIRGEVWIGDHVLIGTNAVVMPNVRIGDGAVVGALSFVDSDIPDWTVAYGQPARPRRERPREDVLRLEALLRREVYPAGSYVLWEERRGA